MAVVSSQNNKHTHTHTHTLPQQQQQQQQQIPKERTTIRGGGLRCDASHHLDQFPIALSLSLILKLDDLKWTLKYIHCEKDNVNFRVVNCKFPQIVRTIVWLVFELEYFTCAVVVIAWLKSTYKMKKTRIKLHQECLFICCTWIYQVNHVVSMWNLKFHRPLYGSHGEMCHRAKSRADPSNCFCDNDDLTILHRQLAAKLDF